MRKLLLSQQFKHTCREWTILYILSDSPVAGFYCLGGCIPCTPCQRWLVTGADLIVFSSQTPPRPIPPWTGRRRNWFRVVGALGGVHPYSLTTGFGRHRTGVVDADVAPKYPLQVQPPSATKA